MQSLAAWTTRQTPRRPHRQQRRRATTRFLLETLEDRVVPTILFPSQTYGSESVADGGGQKLANVTLVPIFWGPYWNQTAGVLNRFNEFNDALNLSESPYFSGLQQYVGGTPHVSVASTFYTNSSTAPTTGTPESTLTSEVFGIVGSGIAGGQFPAPPSFGGSTPIYVVVTPPGAVNDYPASNGKPAGTASGWNKNIPNVLYPPSSGAPFGNAHVIWEEGYTTDDDAFTATLGHETLERMTDPYDPTGVTIGPGQLGDGNARFMNYRVNGVLVQSYWSQANSAYIIPDGNSFLFKVTGALQPQFGEGTGSTLTIVGGQNGIANNDTVTVDRSATGVVTVWYDGQTVQFDSGAINSVVIDEMGLGSLNVSVTGNWAGTNSSQVPITVFGSLVGATTINVTPASGGLGNLPDGLLNVYDMSHNSSLSINDQLDSQSNNWILNGGNDSLNGSPLVTFSSGGPSILSLSTGSNVNNVVVEATPCATVLNTSNPYGTLSFAAQSHSLAAIKNTVTLTGGASALYLYDQADTSSPAVTFDGNSITQTNMATFVNSGIGSVTYYAGSGSDSFSVSPNSKSLDNLFTDISIIGGSGYDSLIVNDSQHTAPTLPGGALNRDDMYTVTGQSISRTTLDYYPGATTSVSRFVNYVNMYGCVTFDADNYVTSLGIESTSAPTTVNLGSVGTNVTVADQSQSLAGVGNLSIAGGSGSNTLAFDDQLNPGYANPNGPASYSVTGSSIARTDNFWLFFYPVGWVSISTTRTINYSNFASVTFNTDNNGTPVDVEGTSTPTTVKLGTGNTTVSIAQHGQSLLPLTSFAPLPMPLTLNGGSGTDTLIVNDQIEPAYLKSPQYTVTSGTISRTETFFSPYPDVATINYKGFSGGVTLYTDNNGTPVDVELTSASIPSFINLGTGNTTVTVAAQSLTFAALGSALAINGVTGTDTLVVNDQKDPNASSYRVTAGMIYKTLPSSPYWTAIYYQGIGGGVILNTDNNGSPVDVEGMSGPTTVNVGSGNTTVNIAQSGQSLSPFTFSMLDSMSLTIDGGTGADALVVNDQQELAQSGTLQYTVTSGAISRTDKGYGSLIPFIATINYKGFSAGVTLNTDNHGTPVDVEGTSTPTTVDLGSGNTAVSVTASNKNLGLLADDLTVNGGTGTDSLSVNDALNPLARTSTSVYYYTVTPQTISRTCNYNGLVILQTTLNINYSNIGNVIFDTDNHGDPVDVEGTSAPTTVNVGSGNTAVSVTASGENLGLLGSNLTVNGGTGTDSLSVNDILNPLTQSYYTLTGQSVARSNYVSTRFLHWWTTLSINYANMVGGVTLDTDNHGTPVDVEGTSAPTTVNVGSGNTAVSVTASGENLSLLGSNLAVNGGTGTDSLTVYDSLNPLAATLSAYGTTTYSYTVTGQSISRTWSYYGLYYAWSTRSVNYANIKGGVTLDTDNNGTPVFISGSPGPNTVTINGGTGTNTLYGPAVATSWSLAGSNAGSLGGWVSFNGFASLAGGSAANSFDFSPAGSLSGSLSGGTGPNILNYARESTSVTVNLATGGDGGCGGSDEHPGGRRQHRDRHADRLELRALPADWRRRCGHLDRRLQRQPPDRRRDNLRSQRRRPGRHPGRVGPHRYRIHPARLGPDLRRRPEWLVRPERLDRHRGLGVQHAHLRHRTGVVHRPFPR